MAVARNIIPPTRQPLCRVAADPARDLSGFMHRWERACSRWPRRNRLLARAAAARASRLLHGSPNGFEGNPQPVILSVREFRMERWSPFHPRHARSRHTPVLPSGLVRPETRPAKPGAIVPRNGRHRVYLLTNRRRNRIYSPQVSPQPHAARAPCLPHRSSSSTSARHVSRSLPF
jgi:hypothetical protein